VDCAHHPHYLGKYLMPLEGQSLDPDGALYGKNVPSMRLPCRLKYHEISSRSEPEHEIAGVYPDAVFSADKMDDCVCVLELLGVMPCDSRNWYVLRVWNKPTTRSKKYTASCPSTLLVIHEGSKVE